MAEMSIKKLWLGISWVVVWLGLSMTSVRADTPTSEPTQPGSFGLSGSLGMNLSDFGGRDAGNDIVASTTRVGFAVSGSANFDIHRHFTIAAGLIYSDQGARLSINGEDRGSSDMSYLHIPVLLQVQAPLRGRVVPYSVLGPALGILLSAEVNSNQGTTADIKDQLKSIDMALVFGLGTSFAMHRNAAIILEARYMMSLISMDATERDEDIKNRVWTFSLGYQHRFGR
jgi:hypothetical protein